MESAPMNSLQLAAADDFIANVTNGNSTDATNGITVSGVSAPAVTSATYNETLAQS